MLEDTSNQLLFEAWQQGDQSAARVLVRRYMVRLTALARSRLSRKLARRIDSEDIVMSVWRSFFAAAGRDQVVVPDDDNLWPLLVTMTIRKLARQAAKHSAERRAMEREVNACPEGWAEIAAGDPTPAEAAALTDELERLMAKLERQDREILTRRLQGDRQSEIAKELGCSDRTVRRAMNRIREVFEASSSQDTDLVFAAGDAPSTEKQPTPDPTRSATAIDATFRFADVLLQQQIGYGTFGKVYRAIRRVDGATIAVKFLRRRFWLDAQASARVIRESQMVSALAHAGIVQHHGWGQTSRGAVFAVMEWVQGLDLGEWRSAKQPTLREIIDCGIEVCAAVDAAHQSGIIHCDLAPRNVLRREADGRFVLTDFGYSHWTDERRQMSVSGTPGFLAPEQFSDAFGSVSPRTDVFGIGALLFFLVAGQPPVSGCDLAEIIARSISATPAEKLCDLQADVPPALSDLVSTCLSKESAGRPESAQDVLCGLKDISANLGPSSRLEFP